MDWLRAIVLSFAVAASGNELKVGGPIQNTGVGEYGKKAFQEWAKWVNTPPTNAVGGTGTGAYTVKLMFENFADSAAITTLVGQMTTSNDAKYVDVLICPYGSGDSKTCIEAVTTGYSGPVMIWGGASDSLFVGTGNPCASKNCIGTFTPGSQYATSALDMLDSKITATLKVALVENNNGFSKSVCSGANTKIANLAGLTTAADMKMTGSQKSDFPQADKDKLKAILAKNPDVVIICGHNGFVEPAIIEIKNHASTPKAIIATNALTSTANTNFGNNIAHQACVMMPTQWKEGTGKDSIMQWDTAAFKNLLGNKATYHAASAAAAGIAILHAMKDQTDFATAKNNLFTNLKALDTDSFYGKLKFDVNGQITKAMAMQQKKSTGVAFVDTANSVELCSGCPPCPVPVVAPAPAVSTPATAPAVSAPAPTPAPAVAVAVTPPAPVPQVAPVPSPVPKISVTAPTPVPQVAPVPSPVPQIAVTAPTPVPQAAPTPVPVPYTPPPAPVPQTAPVPVPVPYTPPPAPVPQTAPSPVPVPPPPVPVPQTAPAPSPVPQVSMTAPTPVPQVAPVPSPVPKVAVTAPTPVPQTAPAPSPVAITPASTPASTPAVVPAPTCPSCTTASTGTSAAHAVDHMWLVLLMACALALHS